MTAKTLIGDPSWMFDLGFPVYRWRGKTDPSAGPGWSLGDVHRIPALQELSEGPGGLSSSMAWTDSEVLLQWSWKHGAALAMPDFLIMSDVYIDTRGSRGIHRANANCHFFQFRHFQSSFAPIENQEIKARPAMISRAKGFALYPNVQKVRGWATATASVVDLRVVIPYESLTGCDPIEFPEWRVMWVTGDRQKRFSLARNAAAVPLDDPSLWCCARLMEHPHA